MLLKNRIRLSRHLRAQTTPYPNAVKWLKRVVFILVIMLGLGIYVVARSPKTNQTEILPKQILGEQESPPSVQYLLYKVKRGDTLFNISQRYSVSWQTLAEINNLPTPYTLKVGQEIKIPN
ncbi:MAG: LysM peptidoglycan-binding domain-containing protein [Candidatus Doudnabacteria bacterium]|nr:LysM peptidoglycan-binding domain-containing protein [Candidatus Doudnabacteria bacterium]